MRIMFRETNYETTKQPDTSFSKSLKEIKSLSDRFANLAGAKNKW